MLLKIVLPALCWITAIVAGIAQEGNDTIDVYPIRVGHQYGYIQIYTDPPATYTHIEPQYDYIGDIYLPWNTVDGSEKSSPYRLFELNKKVGLLDKSLRRRVLDNEYNRIRVVAPNYFAVEVEAGFQLIDSTGQVFLGGAFFDDICLADDMPPGREDYFFVKKGRRWGLCSQSGQLLAGHLYDDIGNAGKTGYYKVREDAGKVNWKLIDTLGKPVIPQQYEDILVLSDEFIAVNELGYWHFMSRENRPGKKQQLIRKSRPLRLIEKLNGALVAAYPKAPSIGKDTVELWSIPAKKVVQKFVAFENTSEQIARGGRLVAPWFSSLDESFAVFHPRVGSSIEFSQLVSTDGRVLRPSFETILPSGIPGVYRVSRRGRRESVVSLSPAAGPPPEQWGLMAPEVYAPLDLLPVLDFLPAYLGESYRSDTVPLMACKYDTIYPFKGPIALSKREDKYGAVGWSALRLANLECLYENINFLDEQTLKVQFEDESMAHRLNGLGRFEVVPNSIVENTLYIPDEALLPLREASELVMENISEYVPVRFPLYQPPVQQLVGLLKSELSDNEAQEMLSRMENRSLPYVGRALDILPVSPDGVVAIYSHQKPLATPFTRHLFGLGEIVSSLRLLDIGKGTYLSKNPILGFRPFDADYSFTAFVAADGQMGLIGRDGRELKVDGQPLRYTYIGPFVAGRARVCMGGELRLVKAGDPVVLPGKFQLAGQKAFVDEFQIRVIPGKTYSEIFKRGILYPWSTAADSCHWAYIDTLGRVVFESDADYVEDYHWKDKTARILRRNTGTDAYGNPDADYGLIDYQGQEIMKTRYSDITNYERYIVASVDSTPTFYFTQKGHQFFVNPTRLRPFSEGLAHFRDTLGRWGYVDTSGVDGNGAVAIPPQFAQARPFSDGLALVEDSTGQCVFIDRKGKVVFSTHKPGAAWRFIGDFHEGRCWIQKTGKVWGAYDKAGHPVGDPKFYHEVKGDLPPPDELYPLPMDFSQGLAAVIAPNAARNFKAAIIDTSGAFILPPENLAHIGLFGPDGLAVFSEVAGGLKGLISKEGTIMLPPKYREIAHFSNGFAKVKSENGRWGLVNRKGEEVVPARYERIGEVAEGLVTVVPENRRSWSYIDTAGQMKIKGPFNAASPFKDGVALVVVEKEGSKIIDRNGEEIRVKGGKPVSFSEGVFGVEKTSGNKKGKPVFYFADDSGNNLFSRDFEYIEGFQLGVATVRRLPPGDKGGKELLGAINKRGVMVVPPKFRRLHTQPDGNIIINPQRYYGLFNKAGKMLIEPICDRIRRYDTPNIFRVEQGERVGYVIIKEKEQVEWAWEMQ